MKVKIDCHNFLGNKPCVFHKLDGRLCENCSDYQKIENRILIIKLDALGDVLRTTSILPTLKEKFPYSEIIWLTRKNALDLLENNPYLSRKMAIEENYLEFILNERFDIGINLDSEPLSASVLSIARCQKKLGFVASKSGRVIPANPEAKYWYQMGLNDQLKKENRKTYGEIIYHICRLKSEVIRPQLFLSNEIQSFGKRFRQKNKLDRFDKIVGINTGGGKRWALKKWTSANYIELIKLINKTDKKIRIILFGGPDEVEFNQKIKNEISTLIIDAGCNNSILQFAALINLVHVFFTPDSLGMHIGVALNKDSIVIVGPTSPWELDVFGNGEILYSDTCNCIACYLSTCDREVNCMNTITPKKVIESIKKYL